MLKQLKKMLSMFLVVSMLCMTLVEGVFAGGPVTVGDKTYLPNENYMYLVSVKTGKAVRVSGEPADAVTADGDIPDDDGNNLETKALFTFMKLPTDETVVSFSNFGNDGRMLKTDAGALIIHNNQPKKTEVGGWEAYKINPLADGTVAISCLGVSVGQFWTVGDDDKINVHAAATNPTVDTVTDAEKFIIVEAEYAPQPDINSVVWIEHKATGNMVTVNGVALDPIEVATPKPDNPDEACKFTVRYGFFNNWTINFEFQSPRTIWFANGAGAHQFGGGMGGWESVTMEPQGDGTVAFKENQNSTYIGVVDGALKPHTGAITENDKFIIHTEDAPKKVNKVTFDEIGRTSVSMSWAPVENTIFTGYEVWRSDSEDGTYEKVRAEGTSTEFTDENLEYGKTYFYAVYTVNGSQPRAEGGKSAVTTLGVDDLQDALDAALAACAGIVEADYTPASWTPYAAALANATTVKAAAKPSVADLESATTTLNTAREALVTKVKVAKDALNVVIAAADQLAEADYTEATWTGFASALTAAKAIVADNAATVAAVEGATTALTTAKDALVTKAYVAAKDALATAIADADELVEADYTDMSWTEFAGALGAAKTIAAESTATILDLEIALTALTEAKGDLVTKAFAEAKTELEAVLDSVSTLKEADYTAESWATFATALSAAEDLLASANPSVEDIEQAKAALDTAKAALTVKPLPTQKPAEEVKLAAPKSVKAVQAGPKKATVTWAKVTGAQKYDVYRSTKAASGYKKVGTVTATSYTDKKASVGKTFYYKVVAVGKTTAENSVQSASGKVAIMKKAAVTLKRATKGRIKVNWKKVSGATGYQVYVSTKKASGYKKTATITKASTKTRTIAKIGKKNLKVGQRYYVKVRAIKKINGKNVLGQWSAPKKITVR